MHWTVIKTEQEYQRALKRLDKIFDAKPGDAAFREAELLVLLIENFETETEEIFPDPDPIEVIKFRMEQNNLRAPLKTPFNDDNPIPKGRIMKELQLPLGFGVIVFRGALKK